MLDQGLLLQMWVSLGLVAGRDWDEYESADC